MFDRVENPIRAAARDLLGLPDGRDAWEKILSAMALGGHQHFYVGVTSNLPERMREHSSTYRAHMILRTTHSSREAAAFERAVITSASHVEACDNQGVGGEGIEPGEGPWVIYVVFR
jgi:hypothetical protein